MRSILMMFGIALATCNTTPALADVASYSLPVNPSDEDNGALIYTLVPRDAEFGFSTLISVRWNTTIAPTSLSFAPIGYTAYYYVDPNPNYPSFTDFGGPQGGKVTYYANGFDYFINLIFPQNLNEPGLHIIGARTTLEFIAQWAPGQGPTSALATVAVNAAPVPEPADWGLLIVGVGLAGGTLRIRRRRLAVAW
ncbi:PEP-CTERM sorting domain-containing protein [Sphingomonas sp. RS6]